MTQLAFDLEPHTLARKNNPATSHASAARVSVFAAGQHDTILSVLRDRGPATAHEIAAYCALDAHQIGKRCGELEKARRIAVVIDGWGDELTRATPSGRQARVWYAL